MKVRNWAVIMIILAMIFTVGYNTEEDLEDEALLSSLALVTPQTLSFKTEDVFSREGEQKTEISKYYISEGSVRYEFKSLVYVYDKENEMIYEWDEKSGEGIFFSAEDDVLTRSFVVIGKTREDVNEDGLQNGLDYIPRGGTLTAAKLTEWKIIAYSRPTFYSPSEEVIQETTISEISDDPIDPAMFLPPDDIDFVNKFEEMN